MFILRTYVRKINKSLRPTDEVLLRNDDETYDEIGVKTASKYLARMKGCWDPELEPSVEEIVDYPMILIIIIIIIMITISVNTPFKVYKKK